MRDGFAREAESAEALRYGVVILAGGEATRLPGKLVLPLDGVPLVVRVYRHFCSHGVAIRGRVSPREIVVSAKATFAAEIDALLPVSFVIDRTPRLGPLGGLLTAFASMHARFVFAVAGDAPHVDAALADTLARAWRPGDEAVVPDHAECGDVVLEPLAALYDRAAFSHAGREALRAGRHSVRGVLPALRTRVVRHGDARIFASVNTPAEYARRSGVIRSCDMALPEIVLPETKPETEWVSGRALQKVSPTRTHGRLQLLLGAALDAWAAGRGDVATE